MANKMFLLLNHSFSDIQKEKTVKEFNIRQFLEIPAQFKQLWQQIPADIPTLKKYLAPLEIWLSKMQKK